VVNEFGKDVWLNLAKEIDFRPLVFKTLLCNILSYWTIGILLGISSFDMLHQLH